MPPANKTKTIGLLTIGLVEASSLAATCLKLAESDSGRPVAITVADVQGESLVVLQQDGVSLDAISASQALARTAAREKRDTIATCFQMREERQEWHPRSVEEVRRAEVEAANRWAAGDTTYMTRAGGHCVLSFGNVIGAIGVCGRKELQDHHLAWKATVRWFFGYFEVGDRVAVTSNEGARQEGKDVSQYLDQHGIVIDVDRHADPNELCTVHIDDGPQILAWGNDLSHE
jgi:uncharacterized protein GlcG (DUF336 family)